MIKAKFLENAPEIHTTPLHRIKIEEASSIIEFDDVDEKRWRIQFKTIQAWKITTVDCFNMSSIINDSLLIDGRFRRYPLVLDSSSWIDELKSVLKKINSRENYLDRSNHYLFILGDDIVEIIAWDNFTIEPQNN